MNEKVQTITKYFIRKTGDKYRYYVEYVRKDGVKMVKSFLSPTRKDAKNKLNFTLNGLKNNGYKEMD